MNSKVILFASIFAFARAGILGEAPVAGQVISAYTTGPAVAAPTSISKSFVQIYTNHRQPVAYASPVVTKTAPVVQAYSAPLAFTAPQQSIVSAYSAPITSQVVSPYSAPLTYSTPLAFQVISPYSTPLDYSASQSGYLSAYSGPVVASRGVAPLEYAAQAPVLSAYSSPIVAKSIAPFSYAANAPVVSAYSSPVIAKSLASVGYSAQAPVVSAYSSPIVSRAYTAKPFLTSSGLSSPLISAYSAGPVVQPW